jgi:hypothetical protein
MMGKAGHHRTRQSCQGENSHNEGRTL